MRGWTELVPTQFATELRWCDSYAERVAELMRADAIVAAAGGIGTLAEIAGAWAALQTEPRTPGWCCWASRGAGCSPRSATPWWSAAAT